MTEEFLKILQKAAAEEAQAQRLYAAMLLMAPTADKEKLIEIFKDESDHAVIIEDMIVKYTTGQAGTISEQTGGVE